MNKGDDIIRFLCCDQATKISGFSLWEDKKLIDYGTLEIEDTEERNPITRILNMCKLIDELIRRTMPDYVVIEDVQYQRSPVVYSQLSQLQGAIFILLAESHNLGFEIIPATKWKAFSKIKGRAREEQKANTILMVRDKYGVEVSEDVADAIGLGTYLINNIKLKER